VKPSDVVQPVMQVVADILSNEWAYLGAVVLLVALIVFFFGKQAMDAQKALRMKQQAEAEARQAEFEVQQGILRNLEEQNRFIEQQRQQGRN
jgi:hypothetical protein